MIWVFVGMLWMNYLIICLMWKSLFPLYSQYVSDIQWNVLYSYSFCVNFALYELHSVSKASGNVRLFFFFKLSQIGNVTFRQLLRRNKRLFTVSQGSDFKHQYTSGFGLWCFVYQEPTFLLPAWHVNLEGKYQSRCVLVK